jgi:hypothetical protein
MVAEQTATTSRGPLPSSSILEVTEVGDVGVAVRADVGTGGDLLVAATASLFRKREAVYAGI